MSLGSVIETDTCLVGQPVEQPAAATTVSTEVPRLQASPYRTIWRWHFYAGILTSPFLMTLAVTGLIYIFSPEIQQFLNRDRLFVAVTGQRIDVSRQLEVATLKHSDWALSRVVFPNTDAGTTVVSIKHKSNPEELDVYVDPYRGGILAEVDPKTDRVESFFDLVINIHRRLVMGTTGRVIVELTSCWGLLLLGTGLYLWWPRRREKVRGVWIPRLNAKPYVILRDLHALSSIYLLPVMVLIVVTGLFYTVVWGQGVFTVSTVVNAGVARLSKPPPGAGSKSSEPKLAPSLAQIETAYRLAREKYPHRTLFMDLKEARPTSISIFAVTDFAIATYGPAATSRLLIDPSHATITKDESLADNPGRWWHSWTYPLHVGSFWGPTTKVIWFLACLVLTSLPVTGLWMWWQRRPTGQTGFPRRPDYRWPWWLQAIVIFTAICLPLAGASIVLIALLDWGWSQVSNRWRKVASLAQVES